MGRLILLDNHREGHVMNLNYLGEGDSEHCYIVCECGWQAEILQFRHPWSTIELKFKVNEHLKEVGAKPYG